MNTVDEKNSRAPMRAADVDRERVAEQLRLAHAEGRLDLAEYDERVRQAWAARTYGELKILISDLPQAAATPVGGSPDVHHRSHWRGRAPVWLSVSLINLLIWGIVSLATLSWIYPWWIWVAGPWGAVLLVGWITERVSGAQPSR
ncbi:MAG: DUF1707 SHOCT-like domain-containing protein [Pseudonocardiaceae bacterium]